MKIKYDGFPAGAMYAPFCRTQAAPMSEWENDIRNMAKSGFNVLHGFAEWHDIEYEKGSFDFSRIDHLVKCACQNNIVPIINVATHNNVGFYSPRWLIEEYRGRGKGFIDSTGGMEQQSQFIVPCLDDPIYQAYAKRYLTAVARHFAHDDRIGGYVLWGEPSLFRPGSGYRICYCEYTVAKFREWLRGKYTDIEKLNRAWSSEGPADYIDFCQVLPPTGNSRQVGGFSSWDDWTEFMEQNLADHIRDADRLFKENGATQPTIVEMLTSIHNSVDAWRLAETTDIIGISCFGRPNRQTALYMSMADSMAKALGKSTFVVEALGGSIKYQSNARSPSAKELISTLLQRAGHGTGGLMYWCWRPRFSDMEGNDFGMTRSDGTVKQKTLDVGKTVSEIQKLYPRIYANTVRKADVAIFHSQKANHLIDPEAMTQRLLNDVVGAVYMLADLHIGADFICEKEILKGSLSKYKVLILPCSYIISEEAAAFIERFVKNGGTVIADYILAEKKPGGFCYVDLPGGGLNKVFGIDRDDILVLEDPSMIEENAYGIVRDGMMDIVVPSTAEVLSTYLDHPLVTCNQYGNGHAYYISSQFFHTYSTGLTAAQRNRLLPVLLRSGVRQSVTLEKSDSEDAPQLLTVSLFSVRSGQEKAVTVTNSGIGIWEDTVTVPMSAVDHIGGTLLDSTSAENGCRKVRFRLDSWESITVFARDPQ
ncbi:MAG: beta-galactosidase [Clostridiales bacterium]|nr:beta-galactosidase [Clostridiales bacterium]